MSDIVTLFVFCCKFHHGVAGYDAEATGDDFEDEDDLQRRAQTCPSAAAPAVTTGSMVPEPRR
jgi:hypothetical protein